MEIDDTRMGKMSCLVVYPSAVSATWLKFSYVWPGLLDTSLSSIITSRRLPVSPNFSTFEWLWYIILKITTLSRLNTYNSRRFLRLSCKQIMWLRWNSNFILQWMLPWKLDLSYISFAVTTRWRRNPVIMKHCQRHSSACVSLSMPLYSYLWNHKKSHTYEYLSNS